MSCLSSFFNLLKKITNLEVGKEKERKKIITNLYWFISNRGNNINYNTFYLFILEVLK